VILDNSIIASGGTNVLSITTNNPVKPTSITINATTNYVIQGPGSIAGAVNILKTNSGTLTISSANTFTGTVTIAGGGTPYISSTNGITFGGSVIVNNANALGATNNTVIVTNGGTLDVGGPAFAANANPLLGYRLVELSGFGASGASLPNAGAAGTFSNGCLINSGPNTQEDAAQNVLLTGDTAIGGVGLINGAGRIDLGRVTPATFSTGGQPFNLYKVGSNQVSFVACTVDTNLGNIDIQGGELGIETSTTSLGNPASNCIVEAGATLETYGNTTNVYTKNFILNGNGVTTNLWNNNGTVTLNGAMTLNNNCVFGGTGTETTNNAVIGGSGALTKMGSFNLQLTAANTYSGNTVVGGGTLSLAGAGAIANSTNLTLQAGATLDVSGRVNGTLTLGGQNLIGGGTLNGTLTNGIGSTVSIQGATNGTIGKLTVTNNAVLLGTTTMKLDAGNATNDVLVVGGSVIYGGTLNLTNLSATPLAANQSYKLFSVGTAGTFGGGSFTLVPATPGAGLVWDTSTLAVNGILKVTTPGPPPAPHITGISLNGTTLGITANNGSAGATWTLLQSTNVTLPLSQWQTNTIGTFDGSGNLSTNIANTVSNHQEFYLLKQ